jgi:hypothetical protein
MPEFDEPSISAIATLPVCNLRFSSLISMPLQEHGDQEHALELDALELDV